jgi:hypothetical protein
MQLSTCPWNSSRRAVRNTVVNGMRKPFTSLPLRIFLPARPLDRDRHKMIEDHKDRE